MKHTGLLVSFLVAAAGIPALGESININFGENITSPIDNVYWNNTGATASGTVSNLVDDSNNTTSASVAFSSNTIWSSGISGVYNGYLDDGGSGVSIAVSGISYLLYDVTVYTSSDFADSFRPMTVNGVSYTLGESGVGIEGTNSWSGTAGSGTSMYGSLSVKSQSGALTVSSGIRDDKLRGCIAGISVTNAYAGTTTSATLNGSGFTWANGSTFGDSTWTNSTSDAGTYAAFTISSDTTVAVDADTGVTTDAITLTGTGTLTLADGGINLIGPSVIRADAGTTIDVQSVIMASTLNSAGAGTLKISSTYAGITNLSQTGAGTLQIATDMSLSSLGVYNGTLAIDSGKTVTITSGGSAVVSSSILTPGAETGSIVLGANATLTTATQLAAGTDTAPKTYDYTKITGEATSSIVFNGAGQSGYNGKQRVTLNADYAGQFVVNNGEWLSFAAEHSSFGNATIVLGGGALFHSTKDVTLSNDIRFDGTAEIWADASNANVTLTGDVSGTGTFIRRGAGAMTLSGNVTVNSFDAERGTTTFTGAVNIGSLTFSANDAATVIFATGGAESKTYSVGKISADAGNNFDRNLTVNEGVTLSATSFNNAWGMNALTVDGVLEISGTDDSGFSGALRLSTGNNASENFNRTDANKVTGTGTIKANSLMLGNVGTYNIDVARLELGSGGITGNGYAANFGATTIAATESWSTSSSSNLTLVDTATGTTFEMQNAEGTGTTATLAGVISGEGKLNKTGAGTLTLSGENTYEGGTTVSAGTLVAENASALGAGAVTLETGGVLQVGVDVTLSSNVTIFVSGSDFYVNDAALTGTGTFAGTVTLDGTLASAIALASVDARSTPDTLTYKIFGEGLTHDSVTVQLSETLKQAMEAAGWTMTTNEDGTVSFAAIPEPSAFGLLAGLGALALVASRRRRTKRA